MSSTEGSLGCLNSSFTCDSSPSTCYNSTGFSFSFLWQITQQYAERCGVNGTWLFQSPDLSPDHLALTNEACEAIVGPQWKEYSGGDIWQRLTTWKLPLFQLVANSPRPPLGRSAEAFTFVHFLADPVGTITDVLRKMDGCHRRAIFWQYQLENGLELLNEGLEIPEQQRLWKSLAIIVDSFDEWGRDAGDLAQSYLCSELERLCSPDLDRVRERFVACCLQTADALAADRSTAFVPVAVAQGFFVGSVAIAIVRIAATQGPPPQTSINIEMWSIAFTAQYFWVIFVVIWKSIIGTSQTTEAIPRILRRFQRDLETQIEDLGTTAGLPVHVFKDIDRRLFNGGLYSWQPAGRWRTAAADFTIERRLNRNAHPTSRIRRFVSIPILRYWWAIQYVIPVLVFASAAGTGQLISSLIPPEGWNCRSVAMMWMSVTWLLSYMFTFIPVRGDAKWWFWLTFAKDLVVIGITFGIVIATQIGIYNRCDCYTQYGHVGLQLPSMPANTKLLNSRLVLEYPIIVALGVAIQLIFLPGLLWWRYHAAVQVFLQRDDGSSNFDSWHRLRARRRPTFQSTAAEPTAPIATPAVVFLAATATATKFRGDDDDEGDDEKDALVQEFEYGRAY